LDLQLTVQSMPITTDVVSSNLDQGEVYNGKCTMGRIGKTIGREKRINGAAKQKSMGRIYLSISIMLT